MPESLQRLAGIVDAPFNYVIHSAPLREPMREHYHWHLEILPRIAKIAGFELASGYYINTVAPEIAARQLREIANNMPSEFGRMLRGRKQS